MMDFLLIMLWIDSPFKRHTAVGFEKSFFFVLCKSYMLNCYCIDPLRVVFKKRTTDHSLMSQALFHKWHFMPLKQV